ncbi:MAG TPA: SDR family oxidoreductase [Candidatus Omnitrophota bacterium]|nr:SDR family oxidoreductase [Candidatus Omnitrophota bacterium]HPT38942.1 SDR family oxidoreductase [Candidatus Omnitrophota bacterium]
MPKQTVLITGGAGFIGSHLCQRLLAENYRVICLDNFITGTPSNLDGFSKDKNFRLEVCDVSDHINISGKLDYVLHCASLASPKDYLDFPIQTLKVGALGTHNALGLAKKKKAAFMLFSTSEVYGDPLVHPQTENYWGHVNPIGVRSCYDESKRFAEAITMAYCREHKVNTKIVRIFNTYGPKMRHNDGRVVPNFISQALAGRAITVYGRGKQSRSFCYIDDLVDGLLRLMVAHQNLPVNLGNPAEFTIMQLVKLVLKLTGSKSKIVFKELPQDDPQQRRPDITRAKKLLGWKPKVSLENGLERTIAWFRI